MRMKVFSVSVSPSSFYDCNTKPNAANMKVLSNSSFLIVQLGFSFFPNFQLIGKRKLFNNFPGISENLRDPKNLPKNFPEVDSFDIFYDFHHFRSNF